MTTAPVPPELRIDGDLATFTRFDVDREQINVTTLTEPDPNWVYTDPLGHWHARDRDGLLPTLRTYNEHVDCAGECGEDEDDCEGYNVTRYECLACGADVTPGSRSTLGEKYRPGRETWSLEVERHIPEGTMVSVVMDTANERMFGFATAVSTRAESGPEGVRVWTKLLASSPLGRR